MYLTWSFHRPCRHAKDSWWHSSPPLQNPLAKEKKKERKEWINRRKEGKKGEQENEGEGDKEEEYVEKIKEKWRKKGKKSHDIIVSSRPTLSLTSPVPGKYSPNLWKDAVITLCDGVCHRELSVSEGEHVHDKGAGRERERKYVFVCVCVCVCVCACVIQVIDYITYDMYIQVEREWNCERGWVRQR